MTDWFARPVLNVKDVEASLRFYVNRLGFTSPGRSMRTAERMSHRSTGRAARLSWPTGAEKIGKG